MAQGGQGGFGGATTSGPAFGQASSIGGKGFGSFASSGAGQSNFAMGAAAGAGSGFSSFASSGFGGLGSNKPAESSFGQQTTQSPFGSSEVKSAFGAPQTTMDAKPSFGLPSSGFALGTSFKRDDKAAEDNEPAQAKSSEPFSLGSSFGNLLNEGSNKSSPVESMDDAEDEGPQQQQKSTFGQPLAFNTAQSSVTSPAKLPGSLFDANPHPPTALNFNRPSPLFGQGNGTTSSTSPLSSPSEKTVVPSMSLASGSSIDPPLPPDATSRTVYGPGDTSASSNVSKSSYDDVPLPPDSTHNKPTPTSMADAAPLPPDFLKKSMKKTTEAEDAPLPPDFLAPPKKTDKKAAEDAPLPPDFLPKPRKNKETAETPSLPKDESTITLPAGTDGSDGDFEDSGEEITHDVSPPSEPAESEFKTSPESSFGGPSLKNSTGGLFTKVSVPESKTQPPSSRPLFGEISQQPSFLPPKPRNADRTPRSPSPVRPGSKKDFLRPDPVRSISAPGGPGGFRKVTMGRPPAASRFEEPLTQSDLIEEEESKAAAAESRRLASEAQNLSSDDEEETRRAELAQPLSPVPTLDPFMPRQEYTGESLKPGIPGQIERLYRDINSMVDTLGLNSRSISSYLIHEEQARRSNVDSWKEIMLGDTPLDIVDQDLPVADIESIGQLLGSLEGSLEEQRLQGVQEKVSACQQLLSHDMISLRDQCASIQRTLDSYTDTVSIRSQLLSAEQESMQHDLRKSCTEIQSRLANFEEEISLLRARIADSSGASGSTSRHVTKRPTVEAVTSTISTMMGMAESKSGDIDVLEAQMKKLGLNLQKPGSHEDSPISTPAKKTSFRVPETPDSDGPRSSYHTPDSTSRFRSSLSGSARHSRLRSVTLEPDLTTEAGREQRKARTRRRKEVLGYLKNVVGEKPIKVRTMDDV
jgi:nucleoporin NUP159